MALQCTCRCLHFLKSVGGNRTGESFPHFSTLLPCHARFDRRGPFLRCRSPNPRFVQWWWLDNLRMYCLLKLHRPDRRPSTHLRRFLKLHRPDRRPSTGTILHLAEIACVAGRSPARANSLSAVSRISSRRRNRLEMSSSDAPKAPSMSASCGLWGGMADHTVALEFAMIVATATVAVAGVYCRGGRGDALYSSESSSDEESEETRSLPTFYRLAYQIKHLQSAQMPS